MKKLVLSILVAAASVASFQSNAAPEVSASVSASNFYLWRGLNLGKTSVERADGTDTSSFGGEAQIAADLNLSLGNGLYTGTWVSSGDAELGTEIDWYAGFGGEVGAFNYDISYWTYMYPEKKDKDFGEAADGIVSLGYGPLTYSYYHDLSKDSKDREWGYMTLGAELGALSKNLDKFGLLVGKHNDSMLHADLKYAYNDNLGFTLTIPLDKEEGVTERPLINANLTLPLKF